MNTAPAGHIPHDLSPDLFLEMTINTLWENKCQSVIFFVRSRACPQQNPGIADAVTPDLDNGSNGEDSLMMFESY
jgi:hypothetical protein